VSRRYTQAFSLNKGFLKMVSSPNLRWTGIFALDAGYKSIFNIKHPIFNRSLSEYAAPAWTP